MDHHAAEKVRAFGTSIFAEMSRLAAVHQAVNLGQGYPDFPGPDFVKEAAKAAIDADLNQYAMPQGSPRLRQAIAKDWGARFGREIDPDAEVTVASGATEVVYDAIQAFIGPGDELIAFEPFYDSYLAATQLAGGVYKVQRLEAPDWSFYLDAFRRQVTSRTKVLLLNTPHNPTGKVFSREELTAIAELAIEHDLVVLADEVYDRIVFDDAVHIPIATLPGMYERTLTINSTGKTFSMTGWKIGYAIGPAPLNAALRAVHQYVTFASATPFQDAMALALEEADARGYYAELARDYAERRTLLSDALTGAGLPLLTNQGSYFLMADISSTGFPDDVAFCRFLIEQLGVAAVPPSAFCLDSANAPLHARFCFAKMPETLNEAGRRMSRLPEAIRQTSVAG